MMLWMVLSLLLATYAVRSFAKCEAKKSLLKFYDIRTELISTLIEDPEIKRDRLFQDLQEVAYTSCKAVPSVWTMVSASPYMKSSQTRLARRLRRGPVKLRTIAQKEEALLLRHMKYKEPLLYLLFRRRLKGRAVSTVLLLG